jgi:hypothetical protein
VKAYRLYVWSFYIMSNVIPQSEGRIVVEERDRDEIAGSSTGEGGEENGGGTGRKAARFPIMPETPAAC